MPAAAQRGAIQPEAQCFTRRLRSRAISIMLLTGLVESTGLEQAAGDAEPVEVNACVMPVGSGPPKRAFTRHQYGPIPKEDGGGPTAS